MRREITAGRAGMLTVAKTHVRWAFVSPAGKPGGWKSCFWQRRAESLTLSCWREGTIRGVDFPGAVMMRGCCIRPARESFLPAQEEAFLQEEAKQDQAEGVLFAPHPPGGRHPGRKFRLELSARTGSQERMCISNPAWRDVPAATGPH